MAILLAALSIFGLNVWEKKVEIMCASAPHMPATSIVFNALGLKYRQTTLFIYLGGVVIESPALSFKVDGQVCAKGISFTQYQRELYDRPKTNNLSFEVCVCVVFSSHSFWTSMDVPAGVTQEEGHTGFLIHLLSAVPALIFLARRIQPIFSLVDREVEFCVLTI